LPFAWHRPPKTTEKHETTIIFCLGNYVVSALGKGYTVAWGGDVSGGFTRTGLAMLPDSVTPTQTLRQEQWDDWRFTYDHVMLIYGKAVDEQGKPYYMVKNSWGPQGDYKGICQSSCVTQVVP